MKKYKIHFSITNLFGESQAEVVKLQAVFKAITASVGASTYFTANEGWALVALVGGAFVNEVLACLYFEEIKK